MQFWPTVLTISVAVFTSLATIWAKEKCFGPKLNLLFRRDEFGTVKTQEVLEPKISIKTRVAGTGEPVESVMCNEIRRDVIYIRLRVQNTGRGIAMKCRGFLTDVEYESRPGIFRRIYFDSIPLCWSYLDASDPQLLDIPKKIDANLDLISAHSREKGDFLKPRLVTTPHIYNQLFSTLGTYRLTVVVAAENAIPDTRKLIIEWNGAWDQLRVRPDDQLV